MHPKQPQFADVANVSPSKCYDGPLLGRSSFLIKDDSSASTDAVSALLIENHSDRVSSNASPRRHGVRSAKAARLRKRNPKRPTSRSERNPRSHRCG
ncbi:hypothetical protein CDAR_468911 [Caerostris darwini]|uniref:Uncharacterized protein n=1 Tax=Caerostris darwini TaxID=1538125 RepID=A0AAV4R7A0_9ARAC|nr:hypothetical protein CDAR_468911 [Caerostris darwini]